MIFLSRYNECFRITSRSCDSYPALLSNQEEADTKVILHSMNVIKKSELGVVLRSPSCDTDVTVLAVALTDGGNRVLYDYGNRDNRKNLLVEQYQYFRQTTIRNNRFPSLCW